MGHRPDVRTSGRRRSTTRGLVLACHPIPSAAVTVFSGVLATLAGVSGARSLVLVAAVLCGQLSIGWSNDRIDAARDERVGRRDKPIAAGAVGPAVVDRAITVALAATVVLSLSLGIRAATAHLVAVGCGWAYNLGLKRTRLSWLPFAVAFGLLPAVATYASPYPALPPAWLVLAGACLGVVGHVTNALPDVLDDEGTGVRGAALRLGARRGIMLSSALMLMATVLTSVGPTGTPGAVGWVGLVLGAALAMAGCVWALDHPRDRLTFVGLIVFVALQLVLLARTSEHLR